MDGAQEVKAAPRDDVLSSTDANHYVIATTFGDGRHMTEVVDGADAGARVEAMRRSGAAPVVFSADVLGQWVAELVAVAVAREIEKHTAPAVRE